MKNIINILKDKKHKRFLKSLDIQRAQTAKKVLSSTDFQKIYSNLDLTFNIPKLPHDKSIWAIAMVKDEADIIESTIVHLFKHGVDAVLVVDNNSTDSTLDILHSLSRKYPLFVGTDSEPAYVQSEKMTWLANKVAEAGAQWIIPFDADEYWYGVSQTLADTLRASSASVLLASMHNQFPTPYGWGIDTKVHPDPKIAFRPVQPFVVAMGNHDVLMAGERAAGSLAIVHKPWRSFEQFSQKLSQGFSALSATNLPDDKGYHWRQWGKASQEELAQQWQLLLAGDPDATLAWRPLSSLKETSKTPPPAWSEVVLRLDNTDV